jgi:hypothetical protein
VKVHSRHNGSPWIVVGVDLFSPFLGNRSLAVPGTPEMPRSLLERRRPPPWIQLNLTSDVDGLTPSSPQQDETPSLSL